MTAPTHREAPYPKSIFARNLTRWTGTLELMEDLGEAMTTGRGKMLMMGGGTPAYIPEVQGIWRERMAALLGDPEHFDKVLADYDQPAGNPKFREAVAGLLNRKFGWPVSARNVAITNGGQTAFFFLMNRFAGDFADGNHRRVLLPIVPEYIGYADQSVGGDLFDSRRPRIELIGDRQFKYRIDFEKLELDDTIGAIAVSRPTNPSSNVLTDNEISHLAEMAGEAGIPLMIDNAYGVPFPGVIFEEVTPVWSENIIVSLSLSKLGLPGVRTGIVVAREEVIDELAAMTAIASLANNNVGQALTRPLMESGEILRISEELIQPFYEAKSELAESLARKHLPAEFPWRFHKREGAFFLWLWFEDLPISSKELYRRLKARNTLIIPGDYFFYGLEKSDWRHAHECIRVSFTQSEEILRQGFAILGEEVERAYRG